MYLPRSVSLFFQGSISLLILQISIFSAASINLLFYPMRLFSSSSWLASLLVAVVSVNLARAQGNLGGDQSTCTVSPRWVHKGCFDDVGNGLHANFKWRLSASVTSERYYPGYRGQITVDFCLTACGGHGFRYAALYLGTECYCASSFPNPDPPATTNGRGDLVGTRPGVAVANSVCNLPCSGNSAQTCGSNRAATVFQDLSFTNATDVRTAVNYLYLGCYNNINPGPMFVSTRTTSTFSCLTYCALLGYPFAARSGVDFNTGATTCGCGTTVQSGLQIPESNCFNYCNGTSGAV